MKIEILRLFLDKSYLEWHSASQTMPLVEAGWPEKKNSWIHLQIKDEVQEL